MKTFLRVLLIVAATMVVLACAILLFLNYLGGRVREKAGGSPDVADCAKITLTSCDLDAYGGSVFGTVENICSGATIHNLEIVSEVYDDNGLLLATDPEYVQNLAPGEQATFEALMDQPASKGTTCRAHAGQGY